VGARLIHVDRGHGRKTEGQTVGQIEGEAGGCAGGIRCFSGLNESAYN
jgi:hypothetical protein